MTMAVSGLADAAWGLGASRNPGARRVAGAPLWGRGLVFRGSESYSRILVS